MAIYHMSVKIHSRSKGESAAACAAYRAGERIYDEELHKLYDYRKKKEAVYKEILLCRNAPAEYQDRETLWNSVMKVEKSKDAQFAREFEIALPREADRESQIKMLHDFFEPLVEEGMCIDFAIHDKGDGNPHCHSLATMRPIREDGSWGDKEKKSYLLDLNGNRIPVIDPATGKQKVDARNRKQWKRGLVEATGWNRRDRVDEWRKSWEVCCNRYLQNEDQIDHRSYADQGKLQEPTVHEGYQARQMEALGFISERCEENRAIRIWNAFLEKARKQLDELIGSIALIREEMKKLAGFIPGRELLEKRTERGDYGNDGSGYGIDELYDFAAQKAAGLSEGGDGTPAGYLPGHASADGPVPKGRSEDPGAAGTDPEMEDLLQRSVRTERSIGEAESGIAGIKRVMDAGKRIRSQYEQLKQERDLRQRSGSLAGYDEGGTIGSISQREAGNPLLVHTEDFIETIECQIERRKRDAAYALGRDRTEVREREVRIR